MMINEGDQKSMKNNRLAQDLVEMYTKKMNIITKSR